MYEIGKIYTIFYDDGSEKMSAHTAARRDHARIISLSDSEMKIDSPVQKGEILKRNRIIRGFEE